MERKTDLPDTCARGKERRFLITEGESTKKRTDNGRHPRDAAVNLLVGKNEGKIRSFQIILKPPLRRDPGRVKVPFEMPKGAGELLGGKTKRRVM